MASVLSRFSFATATTIQQLKNSSNKENALKSTAFWLSVCKKGLFREGNCQGNQNYEPSANTLLERFYAEIKKQTWLNLANEDSIPSKVIQTQTDQLFELFNRTLNLIAPSRCKNVIVYYCFDRTRLFWPNTQVWINHFCTQCARFASA